MNIALFFTRDGNIQLGDTFQNTEGEYSVSLKAASGFSTNFSDIRLGDSIAETVTISNDGTKETITLNLKMHAEGPDDNSDSKYLSPCIVFTADSLNNRFSFNLDDLKIYEIDCLGDNNKDGIFDICDLVSAKIAIEAGNKLTYNADLYFDCKADSHDFVRMKKMVA